MRPVSVGFDGSAESLAAAAWAGREAELRGVPLRVLHVLDVQPGAAGGPGPSAEREWAESRLEVAREQLTEAHPELRVDVDRVTEPPVRALVDAARDAEVLVLGSRELGTVQGFLLGPVSLAVATHAPRPVVVVHEPPNGGGAVVLGLGPARPYDPLLAFAFEAAAARGAVLRIVQVADGEPAAGEQGQRGGSALAETLRPWREQMPAVEVDEWLTTGSAAQHLLEAAAQAALLVVGRREHRHPLGVALGPVAHAALHHAPCPVAIVPLG
ncbi:universal stress protein [Streptomyces morookaense]|uniref:universal stress protein n=1 Tax=Streptomyces morookaense TaxID=1970 RepID=UPI003410D6BC